MATTSKAFVTVLLLSLALCQITAAEPSLTADGLAGKIEQGIDDISKASDKLKTDVDKIDDGNAGFKGKLIFDGLNGIATKVTTELTTGITNVSDADAKLVVEALKKFVEGSWKKLINAVQGKHTIPNLRKHFKDIVKSLTSLKSAFTKFETALINAFQPKEDAKKQFATIKKTIDDTIKIYKPKIPLTPHGDSPVEAIQASSTADGLAGKIVGGINDISTASQKLRNDADKIAQGISDVQIDRIIQEFDVVATKISDVTNVIPSASTSLNVKDDKQVVDALTTFVTGNWKQLIKVLEEKQKVQALRKHFPKIVAALEKLENKFKSFETALTKVLHSQPKEDAKIQFTAIQKIIDDTIKNYGTNIPLTPHEDSPVEAIQEALTTFLQAQQALLNVLIDDRGITTYAGDLA